MPVQQVQPLPAPLAMLDLLVARQPAQPAARLSSARAPRGRLPDSPGASIRPVRPASFVRISRRPSALPRARQLAARAELAVSGRQPILASLPPRALARRAR